MPTDQPTPTDDEAPRKMSVVLRTKMLADGRSVTVGYADDGHRVLEFVNNRGVKRSYALSPAGAEALRDLLSEPPPTRERQIIFTLVAGILDGKFSDTGKAA